VKREELSELHYITPIANLPSIRYHGILSHNQAQKVAHQSVAMQEIQALRAKVVVPRGKRLHDYVNLYIHARNPMMYKRKQQHMDLCVLRISTEVLDLPAVVVSDGNAASDYVRFAPAPAGLAIVDRELAFAIYWTDPDRIEWFRRSVARCAEVLVPDRLDARFIQGAYTSCPESQQTLVATGAMVASEVVVNGGLFFR
jgi:hypothetical protein